MEKPHAEDIESAQIILKLCDVRSEWIPRYPDIDSAAVVPVFAPKLDGRQGTSEPDWDPTLIKAMEKIDAEYVFHKGKVQIYWDAPNSRAEVKIEGTGKNGKLDVKPDQAPRSDRTWRNGKPLLWLGRPIPSVRRFLKDLKFVMEAVQNPVLKTFAFRRLRYLEARFGMHVLFNSVKELEDSKKIHHRDFYNVRKVDTHIHHSACMHQKHLLRFIRHKYKKEGHVAVAIKDGRECTLKEIFEEELGFSAWEASLDHLDVQALCSCFQRFDIFNSKYNPFGQKMLRDVFLKTDNFIQGRYLAELTQEVMEDLNSGKYQHAEWRISIYGRSKKEWQQLGSWMRRYHLVSKRVRWMIQVPRLYHVYKGLGMVNNFEDMLKNIFEPLVEALLDPQSHEDVWFALMMITGWDCVDDESRQSKFTSDGGELPTPDKWTVPHNPPYSYYLYHMYANIRAINELLVARGLRAHQFRPHSGEAGSPSHLATSFLVADGINHGIMLRKSPVLCYIYYLKQIGLALSPISNNALFLEIAKNPFPMFFKIGLNVSLSTDDPLMFHFTSEPLLEEYSIAAHSWKFSPVDLCEIARNSVLQSGFEPQFKRHWLGPLYHLPGAKGNSVLHSNVPDIRLQYRCDTLQEEFKYLINIIFIAEMSSHLTNMLPKGLSQVLLPYAMVSNMVNGTYVPLESPGSPVNRPTATPAQLHTGIVSASSPSHSLRNGEEVFSQTLQSALSAHLATAAAVQQNNVTFGLQAAATTQSSPPNAPGTPSSRRGAEPSEDVAGLSSPSSPGLPPSQQPSARPTPLNFPTANSIASNFAAVGTQGGALPSNKGSPLHPPSFITNNSVGRNTPLLSTKQPAFSTNGSDRHVSIVDSPTTMRKRTAEGSTAGSNRGDGSVFVNSLNNFILNTAALQPEEAAGLNAALMSTNGGATPQNEYRRLGSEDCQSCTDGPSDRTGGRVHLSRAARNSISMNPVSGWNGEATGAPSVGLMSERLLVSSDNDSKEGSDDGHSEFNSSEEGEDGWGDLHNRTKHQAFISEGGMHMPGVPSGGKHY